MLMVEAGKLTCLVGNSAYSLPGLARTPSEQSTRQTAPVDSQVFQFKKEQITIMADKTLTCRDCGNAFTFTEGEQDFYAQKGYSEPSRCPDCRAAKKAARSSGGGYGDSYGNGGGYG